MQSVTRGSLPGSSGCRDRSTACWQAPSHPLSQGGHQGARTVQEALRLGIGFVADDQGAHRVLYWATFGEGDLVEDGPGREDVLGYRQIGQVRKPVLIQTEHQ